MLLQRFASLPRWRHRCCTEAGGGSPVVAAPEAEGEPVMKVLLPMTLLSRSDCLPHNQLYSTNLGLSVNMDPPSPPPADPLRAKFVSTVTTARVVVWLLTHRTTVSALRNYVYLHWQSQHVEPSYGDALPPRFTTLLAQSPFVGLETLTTMPRLEKLLADHEKARRQWLKERLAMPSRRFSLDAPLAACGVPLPRWDTASRRDTFAAAHPVVAAAFDAADAAATASASRGADGSSPQQPPLEFRWEPTQQSVYFGSPALLAPFGFNSFRPSPLAVLAAAVNKMPDLAEVAWLSPAITLMGYFVHNAPKRLHVNTQLRIDFSIAGTENFHFYESGVLNLDRVPGPISATAFSSSMVSAHSMMNAPVASMTEIIRGMMLDGDAALALDTQVAAECGLPVVPLNAAVDRMSTVKAFVLHCEAQDVTEAGDGRSLLIISASWLLLRHVLQTGAPWVSCANAHGGWSTPSWAIRYFRALCEVTLPRDLTSDRVTALLTRKREDSQSRTVYLGDERLAWPVLSIEEFADAAGWNYALGDEEAGVLLMRRYLKMSSQLWPQTVCALQLGEQPRLTAAQHHLVKALRVTHRNVSSQPVLIDAGEGLYFSALIELGRTE